MMTAPLPLTVYRSQFTMRYQFTVIRDPWLIVNGKCMVNSKSLTANGSEGAS